MNSLLVVGQAFQDYFELVTTTEAFKYLSQEKLVLLLSGDGLNVSNEQTVVQSLETWFSAAPEERTESLQDLLCFVRAFFLSSQSLADLKNFLVNHNQSNLCHKLKFDNKTPRQGYVQCIVVLQKKRGGGECLKYLDIKVGCNLKLRIILQCIF